MHSQSAAPQGSFSPALFHYPTYINSVRGNAAAQLEKKKKGGEEKPQHVGMAASQQEDGAL